MTTRIHDPPAPPLWFRVLMYTTGVVWLFFQAITLVYNFSALHPYAHLNLFDSVHEKQVDAVFANVMVISLLTVGLIVGYAYGLLTGSKLTIMACTAFTSTLFILNIICIAILFTSHMMLNHGKFSHGIRQLTIFHKNMTDAHLMKEIEAYAKEFPLEGDSITPASNISLPMSTVPPNSQANGSAYDNGGNQTTKMHQNTTEMPSGILPLGRQGSGSEAVTPYIDVLEVDTPDPKEQMHNWYVHEESQVLYTLSFVQESAFCCGVSGYEDYEKHNAKMPYSCACNLNTSARIHADCAQKPYDFVSGDHGTIWLRPCSQVITQFLKDFNNLRFMLAATAAAQFVAVILSAILGLNMPEPKESEDNDEY